MKKEVTQKNFTEFDKFDRKQKNYSGPKNKSSISKLSIYDEFEDEDLKNYSSAFEEYDE